MSPVRGVSLGNNADDGWHRGGGNSEAGERAADREENPLRELKTDDRGTRRTERRMYRELARA